jgi:hypothetical protein
MYIKVLRSCACATLGVDGAHGRVGLRVRWKQVKMQWKFLRWAWGRDRFHVAGTRAEDPSHWFDVRSLVRQTFWILPFIPWGCGAKDAKDDRTFPVRCTISRMQVPASSEEFRDARIVTMWSHVEHDNGSNCHVERTFDHSN